MEKIESFKVDHKKLQRGLYISRTDGDITTFDIRTRRPNTGDLMENAPIHTVEHLVATYVRNTDYADRIIYFGPMGCRTGFYFLTRNIPYDQVIELLKAAFAFVAEYDGAIPGVSPEECGNYREHDLEKAKTEAKKMLPVLENWKTENLFY